MIIYLLKHADPKFSGVFCGVGFDKGRGSTSSKIDKDGCIQKGCKDITSKVESIKAAQKKKEEAKAAKAEKEADKKTAKADKSKAEEAEDEPAEEPEKEEIPGGDASKPALEEKTEKPEKEKK
jgi:hypothetical protein